MNCQETEAAMKKLGVEPNCRCVNGAEDSAVCTKEDVSSCVAPDNRFDYYRSYPTGDDALAAMKKKLREKDYSFGTTWDCERQIWAAGVSRQHSNKEAHVATDDTELLALARAVNKMEEE